jgi:hypothetical protein
LKACSPQDSGTGREFSEDYLTSATLKNASPRFCSFARGDSPPLRPLLTFDPLCM